MGTKPVLTNPIQDLLVSCFPAAKVYDLQDPSTEEAGGEEAELENVVQDAIDDQLPTPPKSEAKKRKAKDRESTGDEADAPLQKKTKEQLSKEAGKGGGKEAKPTKELGELEKALVGIGVGKGATEAPPSAVAGAPRIPYSPRLRLGSTSRDLPGPVPNVQPGSGRS